MKTSELEGRALDWAVAKCEGNKLDQLHYFIAWWPSTDWSQGGPIIEEREIGISLNLPCSDGRRWQAVPSITAKGAGGKFGYGHTPLIAAMRCYVASTIGDEIEVPEEILGSDAIRARGEK